MLTHFSAFSAAASDAGSAIACRRRASGIDALDHAGQHLARPAFDDVGDARARHALDRLDPAHRAAAWRAERVADRAPDRVSIATSMLLMTGICGGVTVHRFASRSRSCSAAGCIRLEWNGADYRQRQRALRAARLRSSQARSTAALCAGDHGLARAR